MYIVYLNLYIYTDNAKQFHASKLYFKNVFYSDDLKEFLQNQSIQHKTIPAYASWVGGIYERQIKTVKQCLYKTIGRAKLTYFEMITQLSDIQNVVNSRPITYVHSDLNEIDALTPNKILKLHSNPRLQLIETESGSDPLWGADYSDDLHTQLNTTLTEQERLFEKYKQMWFSQYLLSLRETIKDVFQHSWENKISINSIVLVHNKDKPRIFWLMGKVLKLHYGEDGKVRSALLKMPNKQTSHYSIKHLYQIGRAHV
jgi:hypothetical protein